MKSRLNKIPYIIQIAAGLFIAISGLCSCKKFVDIAPPSTRLSQESVYAVDATAAGVLTGLFTGLSLTSPLTGEVSVSVRAGLAADELTFHESSLNSKFEGFYLNALNAVDSDPKIWSDCYHYINIANTALEGLEASTTLTPAVKQQLTGEALFIRAFLHFYLVNLYGEVPLVTSSDYRINNAIARSSKQAVYGQIISDLEKAQTLLSTNYRASNITSATANRVRPNQAAASALLARVYLYLGDWNNAEIESTKVIGNTATYHLAALDDVFLTESPEAIWQLAGVDQNLNTQDGRIFILNAVPDFDHPFSLSNTLMEAFEINDKRKTSWVGSFTEDNSTYYFYPNKYKIAAGNPVTEQITPLRLGELYLIRSEARANLNKLSDARADLNAIRERAGLLPTSEDNQQALLELIYHERQVELFSESGHRWLDLKRTGKVDAVMSVETALKGGVWKSTAQLFPIPQSDLDRDPNLKQNPGYQ